MGLPVFRFTLTHANLGSRIISEPAGWKDAKLSMKRHEEFHSLIEYFEGGFMFYGVNHSGDDGGADFIRQVENLYGADAILEIDIDATFDNENYEQIFNGRLDLLGLQEIPDNKIEVPIIRNDFWSRFTARRDTEVNIRSTTDVDGNPVPVIDLVDLNLPSQTIEKIHYAYEIDGSAATPLEENEYAQYTPPFFQLDEMENFYHIYAAKNTVRPVWFFDVVESGSYRIQINWTVSILSGSTDSIVNASDFYLQINELSPTQLSVTHHNGVFNDWSVFTIDVTLELKEGDVVRAYGIVVGPTPGPDFRTFGFWGTQGLKPSNFTFYSQNRPSDMPEIPTYTRVTAQTKRNQREAQAYFIHDIANATIDRITGVPGRFYSEYFGSTTTNGRQYDNNGCGWLYAIVQGLQLRGYTFDQKQHSISFNKFWKGADPIFNLGLTYDNIAGQEVIRIEQKEYFYDATFPSIYISNVKSIIREYDHSKIYNKIIVGYSKWQSENISGIDDPNSKRTYSTKWSTKTDDLTIISDFVSAGITTEVVIRSFIKPTQDTRYDNDNFIIALSDDDVSPDRYKPELSENFSSVTNIKNYETRYNLKLSCAYNFLRWQNVSNGCLQKYLSSTYKFASGEGNYDMVTDTTATCEGFNTLGPISEKGDLPITQGYLHLPLLYTIEIINFSWDDYVLIRNYRNKAIAISQTTTNHKRFFIKELEYEICKSKCKIVAWPYEDAPILVVDTNMPDRELPPAPEESCGERVRLTEDGDFRVTEDGECRNLEDMNIQYFYQISENQPKYIYQISDVTPSDVFYLYEEDEI